MGQLSRDGGALSTGLGRTAAAPPVAFLVTADRLAVSATVGRSGCSGSVAVQVLCHGGKLLGPGAGPHSPVDAVSGIAQGAFGGLFSGAATSFGQAATGLLGQLGHVFVQASTVNLGASGLSSLTKITLPIAAAVAVVFIVVSMATTAWQHNGSAVATSLIGLCRLTYIAAALITVTQVGLTAADQLSSAIVVRGFGSDRQLGRRLASTLAVTGGLNPALLLVVATFAMVIALVLWAEMLLRHVAIVVLVATAPIAAAGLTLRSTGSWWPRVRTALIQLIVLKPLVVFCLAVGFGLVGSAGDLNGLIAGLITLALAACAWPILARFMTFTSVGAGSGLASAVLGGSAGLAVGGGRTLFAGARPNPGAMSGPGYPLEVERQNAGLMARGSSELGGTGVLHGAPAQPLPPVSVPAGARRSPAAMPGVAVLAVAQGARSAARHVAGAVDGMAAHAGLQAGSAGGVMAPPDGRPLGEQP